MRCRAAVLTLMVLTVACVSDDALLDVETAPDTPSSESSSVGVAQGSSPPTSNDLASTSEGERPDPVTVLAVADLTDCRGPDAEVAELVRSLDGAIVMPGDLANRQGSVENFQDCFLPLYGSELDRIFATPGDNDYNTPGAEPYFQVMKDLPGDPGKGWYAAELGAWQLISLNSNCAAVGGCRVGSEQYEWLDGLLEDEPYACRIAVWHEPRFTSSANYRGIPRLEDFYGRLQGAGTDIVLVGHSHHYERLGPLAANGDPSPDGMMNFTLGIGGSAFTEFGEPRPGSRVRSNEHRGLVRFTLRADGYDWEFVNVDSNPTQLVDTGSASC